MNIDRFLITFFFFLQVAFTGSTEVGRLIMEASAKSNLKPVALELGGKSPFIVFDDADLDKAVELAIGGNFFNKVSIRIGRAPCIAVILIELTDESHSRDLINLQGEACVAGSRVFVQEGIYDRFEQKLADTMKSWVVGDPFDPRVNQGPQVSESEIKFRKI